MHDFVVFSVDLFSSAYVYKALWSAHVVLNIGYHRNKSDFVREKKSHCVVVVLSSEAVS